MSNSLAIAAVTTTLQNLIFVGIRDELGSGRITTLPLDKARGNQEGNQVNLFLYHTSPDLAWKNIPKPVHSKQGTTEKAPLGLNLLYMITAYGEKDSEIKSHRLLGRVMSVLHDRSKLNAAEIEAATAVELPESDLHKQIEQLTIKPLDLSFEEVSQVWRVFQAQYRASVAFEVSVVLIDSKLPLNLALPVLPNGRGGGVIARVGMMGPTLEEIVLPNRQRAAQWGDVVKIRGTNLDHPDIQVRLRHPRLAEPIFLEPLAERSVGELQVQLPTPEDEPGVMSRWRAGFYLLSLVREREQGVWATDALPLAVAPTIVSVDPLSGSAGALTLTLSCTPQIQSDEEVMLLFGDHGVPVTVIEPVANKIQPTLLRVQVEEVSSGAYVLRLRVDGVDSIPVDFTARPPKFAENIAVVIAE